MESRLLYLEKEVGHLRKKVSRLEENIQEETKNYLDDYLKVKLDEIMGYININLGGVKSEVEQQNENGIVDGVNNFNEEILSSNRNETIAKDSATMGDNFQHINDLKDSQDDSERDMTQFRLVDEEIIEIDGDSSSAVVHQTDPLLPGNSQTDASVMPLIRIGGTSMTNTSFYLPSTLSMKQENSTTGNVDKSRTLTLIPVNSKVNAPAEVHNLNFDCSICHERFKCASHLQKHKVKHMTDRPYKCEFCDRDYKRIHHLKEHQTLTHPDEKNKLFESGRRYRCLKCSKLFVRSSLLVAHSKVHTRDGGMVGGVIRYAVEQVKVPHKTKTPPASKVKGESVNTYI